MGDTVMFQFVQYILLILSRGKSYS